MSPRAARTADAKRRGWRTIAQGIAFAVATALFMAVYPMFSSATSWADLDWSLIGFAVFQAVMTGVFGWFQRTYLDKGDPTPLDTPEGD